MKIYISGAITGQDPDEVRGRFDEAGIRLQEAGYCDASEVVNPLDNGLPADSSWEDHMRADLKMLVDCDAVYMLKGWKMSKGATLENYLAKRLGMMIIEQMK